MEVTEVPDGCSKGTWEAQMSHPDRHPRRPRHLRAAGRAHCSLSGTAGKTGKLWDNRARTWAAEKPPLATNTATS